LLGELDSHMACEESVLLPIFIRNGVTGRSDEETLRHDHQRQREEFAALLDLARNRGDAAGLASALQSLVADVLADMTEEETHLGQVKITADESIARPAAAR
jgi:iron-sulfur cluster repair protein YtfE (RIC family)